MDFNRIYILVARAINETVEVTCLLLNHFGRSIRLLLGTLFTQELRPSPPSLFAISRAIVLKHDNLQESGQLIFNVKKHIAPVVLRGSSTSESKIFTCYKYHIQSRGRDITTVSC